MLVVGGFLATAASGTVNDLGSGTTYPSPPDPWPHGVGVFDLAALEWKEGFDVDAGEYVTPEAIRAYNQGHDGVPEAGSTEEDVAAWFQEAAAVDATAPASDTADDESSSTNSGAIAGGVVGGLAALALLLTIGWFIRRRRRQRQQPRALLPDHGEPVVEHRIAELAGQKRGLAEMEGKGRAAELAAEREGVEMDGGGR